jgi:hypothetical protein
VSTHLIRISAARRRISENVVEFLNRSLQFRDAIDPVDSALGNATPRAVRKVPAMRSRATSHARVAEISAVAWEAQRKKQRNFLGKKIVALRAPSQKILWWQDS